LIIDNHIILLEESYGKKNRNLIFEEGNLALTGNFKKFALKWGAAILMMGLVFLFSSIPMGSTLSDAGPLKLNGPTLIRKSGHLMEYGLLAIGLQHGMRQKGWKGIAMILGIVLMFALSDEFHQSFVPGRSARAFDVGIDMLGAMTGLWLKSIFQAK